MRHGDKCVHYASADAYNFRLTHSLRLSRCAEKVYLGKCERLNRLYRLFHEEVYCDDVSRYAEHTVKEGIADVGAEVYLSDTCLNGRDYLIVRNT